MPRKKQQPQEGNDQNQPQKPAAEKKQNKKASETPGARGSGPSTVISIRRRIEL